MSWFATVVRDKRPAALWRLLLAALVAANAAILIARSRATSGTRTAELADAPPPAQLNALSRAAPLDAPGKGEARIVCREAVWDFGTVDQTKTPVVSHAFSIENLSAKPVRVGEIKSCCGVAVASGFPAELPASSQADLRVSVNLGGPPRPLRKDVTIHITSPISATLVLSVRGVVDASPAFYSTPSTVDFGTLRQGETRTRRVKIARFDGSPVKFLRGLPQSDSVSVDKAVEGDDADSFVELTLSLDGARLRGRDFTSSVAVHTAHSTYGEFSIPIKARIAGPLDGLVRSIFVRGPPARDVPGQAARHRRPRRRNRIGLV